MTVHNYSQPIETINPLRRISTASKLILIWLVMISGFGLSHFHALRQQNTLDEFADTEERIEEFKLTALQTKSDMIRTEEMLNTFLLERKVDLIAEFHTAINNVNNGTAALEKMATDDNQQQLIYKARDAVSVYQRIATQLIDNTTTLGLDKSSGQRGMLSKVLEELTQVQQSFVPETSREHIQADIEFANLYWQLRYAEIDFLENPNDERLNQFNSLLNTISEAVSTGVHPTKEKNQLTKLIESYEQIFNQVITIIQQRPNLFKQLEVARSEVENLLESVIKVTTHAEEIGKATIETDTERLNTLFINLLLAFGILVTVALGMLSYSIIHALRKLKSKMAIMGGGDARVNSALNSGTEFIALSNGLDILLTQREERTLAITKENDELNESVLRLTDAADQLSKGDLTITLPISADVTGNIADALNVMTRETVRIIRGINQVAIQLEQAVNEVDTQGKMVFSVAATERQTLVKVLQFLEQSAATMIEVARIATTTNELASNASETSKKALIAVRATTQKMEDIRTTVSEAEKITKRLGERSQEIGSIVEIIKDIAERTHTLALNAGMHAIIAGEAGRGFSVVADEVQRLAETVRESTKQITTLVRSLQAESAESMITMNKTITQVVQVVELAERSGKRMSVTQKTTQDLATAVNQIAERSKLLEVTNSTLHEQAMALQNSTHATERAMQTQAEQTNVLIQIMHNLVQSVRIFKLPNVA